MSLFRRNGKVGRRALGKGRRPAGSKAEKDARRRSIATKSAILVTLIGISVLAFVRDDVFRYTVQIGDVWRQDNLLAPYRFAVLKTDDALEEERVRARLETPPFFRPVADAGQQSTTLHALLSGQVARALGFRAEYVADLTRGRMEEAAVDSVQFDSARAAIDLPLSTRQWLLLSSSYNDRIPTLASSRRSALGDERLDARIFREALETTVLLQDIGVLDIPVDSVKSAQIKVRDATAREEEVIDRERVFGREEALRVGRLELERRFDGWSDSTAIAAIVLSQILVPSLEYDANATRAEWELQEASLSPTEGIVLQNEVIVRTGDIVTSDTKQRLISLEREEADRRGDRSQWSTILGQLLLTLAVYIIFFLYLFLLRRSIFEDNRLMLLVALLFATVIGMDAAVLRVPILDIYVVPAAIAAIVFTVIFDSRVAIFGLLTLTLLGSLYLNLDFTYAFATLFAGSLGVFSVRDIRNRGQFFVSAGMVFVGYAVVLFGAYLVQRTSVDRLLSEFLFVGINSFLLLLAYPLLWVFERAFGLTTDLTLLELSDTNRPLLKELSMRAPGTFNHTLQVANLAEAAAASINANPLLTRVGALYHDIGKMVKPEYFVENQRMASNPHDQLKPRMSALIIASHVKDGMEIGLENRLPQAVLDFIPMHHGTTRIEYFYRRALDQHQESESPILESEFRYPGPRPASRETSILMLADTVEAASRTLENPTHNRLEGLIATLVEARRADGQLDDADLTFRDLTVIKKTFLAMLMGVYHVRVKYPGAEDEAEAPALAEASVEQSEGAVEPEASGSTSDREAD